MSGRICRPSLSTTRSTCSRASGLGTRPVTSRRTGVPDHHGTYAVGVTARAKRFGSRRGAADTRACRATPSASRLRLRSYIFTPTPISTSMPITMKTRIAIEPELAVAVCDMVNLQYPPEQRGCQRVTRLKNLRDRSGELAPDESPHESHPLVGVDAGGSDEAVAGAREMRALDLPASPPIGLEKRVSDGRRDIVVEPGLREPDWWQHACLCGRHHTRDTGLRHRRLVGEVAVVRIDQTLGREAGGRLRLVLAGEHVAIARQRVRDRIERDDERHRIVGRAGAGGAVGQDDRGCGGAGGAPGHPPPEAG